MSLFSKHPRPWRLQTVGYNEDAIVDSGGNPIGGDRETRKDVVDFINSVADIGKEALEGIAIEPMRAAFESFVDSMNEDTPAATLNHDNHTMLARRVGELEQELAAMKAAMQSARLIFGEATDA